MIQIILNSKVSAFNPIGALRHMPIYLKLLATAMFGAMTGINCVGNVEIETEKKSSIKSSIEFLKDDARNLLYVLYKLAPGDTKTIELDIKNNDKYILNYQYWINKFSPELSVTHTYDDGTPLIGYKLPGTSWAFPHYEGGILAESNRNGKMILTVKNNGTKLLDFSVGFHKVTELLIQEDQNYPIKKGPTLYKMNFKKDQTYQITKDVKIDYLDTNYQNVSSPFYGLDSQTISFNEDKTYYFIYQDLYNSKEGFFKIQMTN